jgi:hypothetical protein
MMYDLVRRKSGVIGLDRHGYMWLHSAFLAARGRTSTKEDNLLKLFLFETDSHITW